MAETDSTPVRIQRTRRAGWRMPEATRYVGRGSRWGNPYRVGDTIDDTFLDGLIINDRPASRSGVVEDREHAVELFAVWVQVHAPYSEQDIRDALTGQHLACWCPDDGQPCHGDVLVAIANTPPVALASWDD